MLSLLRNKVLPHAETGTPAAGIAASQGKQQASLFGRSNSNHHSYTLHLS